MKINTKIVTENSVLWLRRKTKDNLFFTGYLTNTPTKEKFAKKDFKKFVKEGSIVIDE